MLNILIKLRLNRRSLQIVDLQVSIAQLPGHTKVRPPWAKAHGNQNISCFYSGIVLQLFRKGPDLGQLGLGLVLFAGGGADAHVLDPGKAGEGFILGDGRVVCARGGA